MIHSFDIGIAEKAGVHAAIIYQNILHWCAKNKANGINHHDGKYWTYNSVKAFSELFPYLTYKQIRRALDILIDLGLIEEGNYNASTYDRTKWYAVTGKCICPTGQMEMPQEANGDAPQGKPIPDNKPLETTDTKQSNLYENSFGEESSSANNEYSHPKPPNKEKEKSSAKKEKRFGKSDFRATLITYGADPIHVDDWITVRTARRAVFTETALNGFLDECEKHDFFVPEAVKICAENSWTGFKVDWLKNKTASRSENQSVSKLENNVNALRSILIPE